MSAAKRRAQARNRRTAHVPARSGLLGTLFGQTPSRTTRRRIFRQNRGLGGTK